MYSGFRLIRKYLQYYLTASNGKGHGVHSPFVYAFIRDVLNDHHHYDAYLQVENMRARLLKDHRVMRILDLGAGSAADTRPVPGSGSSIDAGSAQDAASGPDAPNAGAIRLQTVSAIAGNAAKSRRLGQLLFRIAQYYRPSTILELGTSLGISTAYLALGAPGACVLTIEGAPSIAEEAKKNFRDLGLTQIEAITGNFDTELPSALGQLPAGVELVFIDGNHRREPTLRYFNMLMERMASPALLIFDDIHWSAEMEEAWKEIKTDSRVMLTVDLFFIGLVFLRTESKIEQHFVVRF